jgi:hypothetical protein
VKFIGLSSMIWQFGEEAIGIMAPMKEGLDGGGLLLAYGISTLRQFTHILIPTRHQSW